jgi:hypothetical protein
VDVLGPILFGWPALILALALAVAGLVWSKPWLHFAGAILVTPPSIYLIGSPRLGLFALSMPLFLVGAALFLRAGRWIPAALLTSVPFAIVLIVAVRVVTAIR